MWIGPGVSDVESATATMICPCPGLIPGLICPPAPAKTVPMTNMWAAVDGMCPSGPCATGNMLQTGIEAAAMAYPYPHTTWIGLGHSCLM